MVSMSIDINKKDYRGWYGLGQAYELLNMPNYSLYYYQHGAALRPYDVRMWQAMGTCYQDLGRRVKENYHIATSHPDPYFLF